MPYRLLQGREEDLFEISEKTHAAVVEAITTLKRLDNDGKEPIPSQWWGIVALALYSAAKLGVDAQKKAMTNA